MQIYSIYILFVITIRITIRLISIYKCLLMCYANLQLAYWHTAGYTFHHVVEHGGFIAKKNMHNYRKYHDIFHDQGHGT
jgi:hypothetical protein